MTAYPESRFCSREFFLSTVAKCLPTAGIVWVNNNNNNNRVRSGPALYEKYSEISLVKIRCFINKIELN